MDNIQLCYIDNEINKIDKMKQGDVIYKNGMELLVVLSYDHEEPCRGCFFYKDKKCGSERLIKCWNCNKEYIFTVIRENDTTELDNNDKDNINRKPNTGMIDQYMDYIKFINDNVDEENKIIYDTVMMIGDASGKEGQFSDSDKKTAENFGCEYMDVDDFVDKYKG